jgi:hypothetical protein
MITKYTAISDQQHCGKEEAYELAEKCCQARCLPGAAVLCVHNTFVCFTVPFTSNRMECGAYNMGYQRIPWIQRKKEQPCAVRTYSCWNIACTSLGCEYSDGNTE